MSQKTRSMFDQILYALYCPKCQMMEPIVVGRLQNRASFPCSSCGHEIDLQLESHQLGLARKFDTADQLDKQAMARGEEIFRESK